MKMKRIAYTFIAMAGLCFISGITVLSHPEGTDTEWTD